MASSGYCSNYTVCGTAAGKRVVDLKANRDHCPDCGMMLHAIADMESLLVEAGALRNGAAAVGSAAVRPAVTTETPPPAPADRLVPDVPVTSAPPEPARVKTARTKHFSDARPPAAPPAERSRAAASPKRMILAGAAAVALIVCGVAAWATFGRSAASPLAFEVCGSNLLGSGAGLGLVQGFLTGAGATKVSVRPFDGRGDAAVAGDLGGSPQRVGVRADGTTAAYALLAAGACQAAIVDRPPTQSELGALRARYPAAAAAVSRTLALDAVTVVVNPSNPLTHLTLAQVRRIFSGDARSWSDVGGAARPFIIMAPADDSDVARLFAVRVLDNGRLASAVRRPASERGLSAAVAHDRDAIGLVPFSDSSPAKVLALGSGDAFVAPSSLSIGTAYPLTLRLSLYAPDTPGDSLTHRFIEYLGTADAKNVIGNAGLVPAGP